MIQYQLLEQSMPASSVTIPATSVLTFFAFVLLIGFFYVWYVNMTTKKAMRSMEEDITKNMVTQATSVLCQHMIASLRTLLLLRGRLLEIVSDQERSDRLFNITTIVMRRTMRDLLDLYLRQNGLQYRKLSYDMMLAEMNSDPEGYGINIESITRTFLEIENPTDVFDYLESLVNHKAQVVEEDNE